MSHASDAVGLAGDAGGPYRLFVWPSCKAQGVAPSADAGEEVALSVASEVVGANKSDVSFIYVAWRDASLGNEEPKPLRRVGVDFVVVGT